LGRELGARSDDPECYLDGKVQYDRLAATPLFASGIDRLLEGSKNQRIALMCAERDPLDCHRALLVGRRLVDRGIHVAHILADGSLELHEDAMMRLREVFNLADNDLFYSGDDQLGIALSIQEARIAYVVKPDRSGG